MTEIEREKYLGRERERESWGRERQSKREKAERRKTKRGTKEVHREERQKERKKGKKEGREWEDGCLCFMREIHSHSLALKSQLFSSSVLYLS